MAPLDASYVWEVYAVRSALESLLVEVVTPLLTKDDFRQLRAKSGIPSTGPGALPPPDMDIGVGTPEAKLYGVVPGYTLAHFRYRRSAPDEPEVANCGIITIDFLRDGKILHSANLKPARLERESWSWVKTWLNKRDLLKKAGNALVGPRKKP